MLGEVENKCENKRNKRYLRGKIHLWWENDIAAEVFLTKMQLQRETKIRKVLGEKHISRRNVIADNSVFNNIASTKRNNGIKPQVGKIFVGEQCYCWQ